jgi:hypothetical protein
VQTVNQLEYVRGHGPFEPLTAPRGGLWRRTEEDFPGAAHSFAPGSCRRHFRRRHQTMCWLVLCFLAHLGTWHARDRACVWLPGVVDSNEGRLAVEKGDAT